MKNLLMLAMGGLYVISPIDILPDVIPVLGWIDDIGVVAFLIKTLTATQEKVRESRLKVIDGIPIE